jgi:pimeloyl-ACP methyl ester carboxylesterase
MTLRDEYTDRPVAVFTLNYQHRGLGVYGRFKGSLDNEKLSKKKTWRRGQKGKIKYQYAARRKNFIFCFGDHCLKSKTTGYGWTRHVSGRAKVSNWAPKRKVNPSRAARIKAFQRIPKEYRSFSKFKPKAKVNENSWVNHFLLSIVSAVIYERDDLWRRSTFNELGIKQVEYVRNPGKSGLGAVETAILRHDSGAVIVVCRGTQGFKDKRSLLRFPRVKRPYFGNAKANRGYILGMSGAFDGVMAALNKHVKPGDKIWFTGHSLGAAVAQLLAHRIAGTNQGRNIQGVVTFAGPPPGSKAWARHYAKMGLANKTIRWVNHRDAVPHIGTAGIIGAGHSGPAKYIDWLGQKVIDKPSIKRRGPRHRTWDDHPMTRYSMRIWHLMPAQYKKGLRSPRNFLGEINGEPPNY